MDAEEKRLTSHRISLWLRLLRDAFYDAEDILDDFTYGFLRNQIVSSHGGLNCRVCHFFSRLNPFAYSSRIAHKIKEIRERVDEINADREAFHFIDRDQQREQREREMFNSFVNTSDVIGREDDREIIVKFLLDRQGYVISIVGIGGIGKTALAKTVFEDDRVVNHFSIKVWACLSDIKEFSVYHLGIKLVKSIAEQSRVDYNDFQHLADAIQGQIQDKKFLLVLDDIWNEDSSKWAELKALLASGAEGSKILVTTRSHTVARCVDSSVEHKLEGLNHDESVTLFKKVAFASAAEVDENLMIIGDEIVRQCKGIPLAVRSLGRLLFSKSDEREWISVRGGAIFKFSYDQLPPNMKKCFLYCSVFPDGFEFWDYSLISFWMAHKLLISVDNKHQPEYVGKQYIDEFLSIGFFKDFRQIGAGKSTFKMNDLVAELARSLSQDEFQIIDADHEDLSENVRHVWFEEQLCLPISDCKIRSVIVPHERLGSSIAFSRAFLPKFKNLRFLLIAYSDLEMLPKYIGTLKYLRSLDLEGCSKLKKLPKSICKLLYLETLSLKGCAELEELPKNIGELVNLRWLCITTKQKHLSKNGIESLRYLQFLWFSCCPCLESLFEGDQVELISLQTLIVEECNSLISLFGLSNSAVRHNSLPALEVLDLASCEKLNLDKDIDGALLELATSLTSLAIGKLPHLEALPDWIQKCANNLGYMEIRECCNLRALPEWLPTLTKLRILKIRACSSLLSLPERMQCLTVLEHLEIISCGHLSEICRGDGVERFKISHVPNIAVD